MPAVAAVLVCGYSTLSASVCTRGCHVPVWFRVFHGHAGWRALALCVSPCPPLHTLVLLAVL